MPRAIITGKKDQFLLFGSRIDERLDPGHEVYAFDRLLDEIPISIIEAKYSNRGGAIHDPRTMLKILFYGYFRGIRSSRRLAAACEELLPFIYLSGDVPVKFRAIADFRVRFATQLKTIFEEIVALAFRIGMVRGKTAYQDGSKFRASANNAGFKTIKEWEEEKEVLIRELKEYFEEATRTDAQEDAEYGEDSRGDIFPVESRKSMEEKIQKIIREDRQSRRSSRKSELETAPSDKQDAPDSGETEKPAEKAPMKDPALKMVEPAQSVRPGPEKMSKLKRLWKILQALAINKGQAAGTKISLVDPESRFIKHKAQIDSNYNVQIITEKNFILATEATNEAADQVQMIPVLEQLRQTLPECKTEMYVADAGYFSGTNLQFLHDNGINGFIPERSGKGEQGREDTGQGAFAAHNFLPGPDANTLICPTGRELVAETPVGATKRTFRCKPDHCMRCSFRTECLQKKDDLRRGYRSIAMDDKTPYRQAMRRKMETREAREIYKHRAAEPEPVFGNLKFNKRLTGFVLRGLKKVNAEVRLMAGAHNLGRIIKWQQELEAAAT
jgi:transposase